ncbi:dephospho-CoA kinase [Propionivibrio limicola]|uniref:dephospho-CoA kinase n=1 Tax=Propionivibrio limicola TaxID=167645 RepID=UPI00129198C1|nr:dephospho-CoA kinase [Propionivibrio limicola]
MSHRAPTHARLIIGLTGGIGSGKSTAADLFAMLGAKVVDTDGIAHELTAAGGAAMPEIIRTFGAGIAQADGSLDRAAMRRLCFSDPGAKRQLEAILHPMIRRESAARCQAADNAPYVLLVVPLLVESGAYRAQTDRTVVVDCEESVQIERVMARSGLSADEVRAIMATQATRADRLAAADDVLTNNDGKAALQAQVERLHQRYLALAAGRSPA